MTTMNLKHFDKLSFVDEAKQIGITEEHARFFAQKLEEVEDFKGEELATKAYIKDLRSEVKSDMKDLELRIIKWLVGTTIFSIVTTVTTLISVVKYLH